MVCKWKSRLTSPIAGELQDVESSFLDGEETSLIIVQDDRDILVVHRCISPPRLIGFNKKANSKMFTLLTDLSIFTFAIML